MGLFLKYKKGNKMRIKLDNKFIITSDNNSFTLSSIPIKKEDSIKESAPKFVGSYGDLGSALNGYIKNEMRSKEIDIEVNEIISYLKDLENKIKNAIKDTSC